MFAWQPSLLDLSPAGATGEGIEGRPDAGFDTAFCRIVRTDLDRTSWVEHQSGWVHGAAGLFEHLRASRPWAQHERRMLDRMMLEPRLTAGWSAKGGSPLDPPVLEAMRVALSKRYRVRFDSVGMNLYRDGADSVAWHGDRIGREIEEPFVVLVSLGFPRTLLLRPKGGGRSTPFRLGHGDLLVTAGRCQREWEHCVPKVASAGPRISLAFRHSLAPARRQRPPDLWSGEGM